MNPIASMFLSAGLIASTIAAAGSAEPGGVKGTAVYNEWLGREFVTTLVNSRDPKAMTGLAQRVVAADYIQHNPLAATAGPGRNGLLHFLPVVFASFPDAHFELRDVFANGEMVAARWTFSGTFTGAAFAGIPPTNKAVQFDGIDVWSVKDGQLYEHWDQIDWTRFFVESGVRTIPQVFRAVSAPPDGVRP